MHESIYNKTFKPNYNELVLYSCWNIAFYRSKLVFADTQFLSVVEDAIAKLEGPRPTLIEVPDEFAGFPATGKYETYERFLKTGNVHFDWIMPQDEWERVALNYTSGTTGKPKGVV